MAEIPKLQQVTHAADRRHEYTHFDRIHLERKTPGERDPKRGKSDFPGRVKTNIKGAAGKTGFSPTPPADFHPVKIFILFSLTEISRRFLEKALFCSKASPAPGRLFGR